MVFDLTRSLLSYYYQNVRVPGMVETPSSLPENGGDMVAFGKEKSGTGAYKYVLGGS